MMRWRGNADLARNSSIFAAVGRNMKQNAYFVIIKC
jgi:hypothetical protein